MAKHQFRAELNSGPTNLRKVTEKASQTYVIGDVLKYSSGAAQALTTTTGKNTPFLGVAAKKGQNLATPVDKSDVYIFSPEQVWEIHAKAGKKPSSYTINTNYKLLLTSNASFTITPLNGTATTKISVKGPVVSTGAGGSGAGVVVVGWSSMGYNKKGQTLLVRFAESAWGS